MFGIKTIVIIIAVNIVKAEHGNKQTNSEEKTGPHILPAANIRQLNDKRSWDTSLGPSDDYESIEYDKKDNEHTRRFGDNQDEQSDEDRNANLEGKSLEDTGHEEKSAKGNGHYRHDKDGKHIDPNKKDMMTHHIILDTKGRSAAEDAEEDGFKTPTRDMRSFDDPRLGITQNTDHRPCDGRNKICRSIIDPSRSGIENPFLTTISRPGLLQPLYAVNHPLLQTNQELPQAIIKAPLNEMENLPFVNLNSYPYQRPLTKMVEPNYNEGPNLDILKKLIDATNSALTANQPVPYFENYPGNLPGGRLRRSTEIKINPLVTIVLPKGQQLDTIPSMVNWGKINNFCC